MILYFDKYGTLIRRDNEGETWVQGDDQSYSLKVKFYDDTQGNITEDTPFIDLSNYVVNCVVEREDGSITPTLTMNRFDENTGAKVLVDNWWTEINGNITVTTRLVDIVDNSVKATGLATITINKGNIPSDTTITNSEKAALEEAIALKEDKTNKTTNVRTEAQASDVLYPSEKAVAKVRTALNEILNVMQNYINSVKTTADTNKSDITAINTTIANIRDEIGSLSAEDTRINEKITSIEREIGTLVIGADFVPKTRTIAEISLENDITKQSLVEAIISLFGSAAQVDTGYTPNTIPVIGNDGKLPKNIIPINDGLIYGGAIESVGDYEALVYPSDAFIVKYPDTPTGDTITINRETTDYTDVYFVVQGASSEGDTILGIEGVQNGDWIIANAERGFLKIDNVDAVKSVNGMLGVVQIKPKDLILENYATSELDDNNIYPTDSAQTGISKLDKRVKTLEAKETEELPNVVLEIKDLDAPTASEQAIIIQKIKELTNNFTTSLDTTKFNEIVLKNDKTTTTTTQGEFKSFTGSVVTIPSGWSCSANYNTCHLEGEFWANNTFISDMTYIAFGFEISYGESGPQLINRANSIAVNNGYGYGTGPFYSVDSIELRITNDLMNTDTEKEKFLQFINSNNGTITGGVYEEGETITTPDLRQYSLVSYEHKVSDPTYYKFTFNLGNNTEYEIIIGADETVGIIKTEFAKKSDIPTKTSQLTNDSGFLTSESDPTVPAWAKASSKPSYSYSEITGKPTIPTVYNPTITIQKNGSSVGTFTLNASSGKTINIIVPTKLSELSNNESKFVSETYLSGVLADYASKEDLESIEIPQAENKVTEEVTITSSIWVEDTNVSPFSYIATISLTNLKASSTSIELLNNNAILFATFGFAIGSVSESSVIIYAMGKPTEDVTLTFEVVNPVASDGYTVNLTISTSSSVGVASSYIDLWVNNEKFDEINISYSTTGTPKFSDGTSTKTLTGVKSIHLCYYTSSEVFDLTGYGIDGTWYNFEDTTGGIIEITKDCNVEITIPYID